MLIRNMTRHDVRVEASRNGVRKNIAIKPDPEGPAFVKYTERAEYTADFDGWSVDLYDRNYHYIEGLPEPQEDTLFIVSRPVADHPDVKNRDDILVCYDLVFDRTGGIDYARGFKYNLAWSDV